MKYQCDMIQDLLPLYEDGVCSEVSKAAVEEHLRECGRCREVAGRMKDRTLEETLAGEKDAVLAKHRRKMNQKSAVIAATISAVMMIPIIVCLICNLAIGHALDWFFIVLTAMLLVASLLVVPMVAVSRRFMRTIVCATASLLLLLLTCCIYTHGSWFWVAATACIFGLSVVFAPFVIKELPLNAALGRHKACLALLWDSVWLYILLAVCGVFVHGGLLYWQIALAVSTYLLLMVWFWLLVLQYMKKDGWTKAGLLTLVSGIWFGISNDVMGAIIPDAAENGLRYVNIKEGLDLDNIQAFNANLMLLIIAVSVCAGLILIGLGRWSEKRKDVSNKS